MFGLFEGDKNKWRNGERPQRIWWAASNCMDMDGDKSQENKMGKKDIDKIFPSTTLKWIIFNTEHVGFFVSFFHPPKVKSLTSIFYQVKFLFCLLGIPLWVLYYKNHKSCNLNCQREVSLVASFCQWCEIYPKKVKSYKLSQWMEKLLHCYICKRQKIPNTPISKQKKPNTLNRHHQ